MRKTLKEKKQLDKNDKKEILLIFLCWLVYASAYLGKYSYTSNMVVIGPYYNVSKAEVGLVGSFFFIAYGIGQIVNAFLCKYYHARSVVASALIVSAAVNTVLFFDIPFTYVKYLWLANALAQSVLWPTLVQIIGTHIRKERTKTAVLAMATTVAVGTILSYAISALFVQIATFKVTFIFTGIYLFVVASIWLICFSGYGKAAAVSGGENQPAETDKPQIKTESVMAESRKRTSKAFFAVLLCLAVFAIIDNFVKDGLNSWVPDILKKTYNLPDSLSIVLTITLSVLGVFGAFAATFLNKYVKDFVLLCGVFFVIAMLLILGVLGLLNTKLWYLTLVCLGLISLIMHAINNVITSMFPLYLPDRSKSGLYSGLLNGACYAGSAVSSYGLGAFADSFGWYSVFQLLLASCIVPVIISVVRAVVKIIKRKKTLN